MDREQDIESDDENPEDWPNTQPARSMQHCLVESSDESDMAHMGGTMHSRDLDVADDNIDIDENKDVVSVVADFTYTM